MELDQNALAANQKWKRDKEKKIIKFLEIDGVSTTAAENTREDRHIETKLQN